ncbi:MAG: ABC transporter permease subunit [Akkermansia sp.]|nr:ABC transporter permease subunit [Akkermansia sp.]
MKHKNLIALFLILAAILGCLAELRDWLLPTLSWPFTVSREMSMFSAPGEVCPWLAVDGRFHWFGWACMGLVLLAAAYLLLRRRESMRVAPVIARRWAQFRSFKRGYFSLMLLVLLMVLAGLDQAVVGKRALVVCCNEKVYFPAFSRSIYTGAEFGLTGNAALAEADYRKLREECGKPGMPELVIMPPIPFDATMDAAPFPREQLIMKEGVLYEPDGLIPYVGQACRVYPNGRVHLRVRYRKGVPDGHVQGWTADGREVYTATYREGKLSKRKYMGDGKVEAFLSLTPSDELWRVYYHPAPPLTGGHLLGTNSQGADIAAYLFGGLQVNIKAALFYLPVIYSIGLLLGMLMGYFAGKFDLVTQRVIEVFSQLPFLFVVMVLSDFVPHEMRGMFLIMCLLSAFGWIHITYLVRTATMKEKTRDYVAAARVMGAGTVHILLRHILPNLTGIIVTLLPFSLAAVVLSLASLDYMGFGLPDTYASWGRLLNDGLSKLSSPWVVSSAFFSLVILLVLVTFVGEAVREAVDPRRHTYYE